MSNIDAAFQKLLKDWYTDRRVQNVAVRDYPLLSMMEKKQITGDDVVIPLIYGFGAGRSGTAATAIANASLAKYTRFKIDTFPEDVNVTEIKAQTIAASKDKVGAFMDARKAEINNLLKGLGKSAAYNLFGDGGGTVGEIASVGASSVTLTVKKNVKRVEIDSKVQFATASTGGSLRDSGDTLTVSARDPSTGTITFTTATSNISGLAVGDFAVVQGDYDTMMNGLAAWLPLTAPTSGDNHYGVDRSVDTESLAGHRLDEPGAPIEDSILKLTEEIVDSDGRPNVVVLNNTNFGKLARSVGSKVQYTDAGGNANVGFQTLQMHTHGGSLSVVADPACPTNRGYVLQMDTWRLYHLDPFPHIYKGDGIEAQRLSNSMGIQVRALYWAQPGCEAPAYNGVFSIG